MAMLDRGRRGLLAAGAAFGCLAGLAAPPAAAFDIVAKSNAWVHGKNLTYFTAGNGFAYQLGPGAVGDSWGGVECGYFGCWGAKAWANGAMWARAGAGYGISNSMTSGALAIAQTHAALWPGAVLEPGAMFVLLNESSHATPITKFGAGKVQAQAGAAVGAHASIGAKVCTGYCWGNASASLPALDEEWTVVDYDTTKSTLTFMNKTTAFPPSGSKITSDDKLFSFIFDKHSLAGGVIGSSGSYETTQSLGGIYGNLAVAAAMALGLPKEAISGSVLGINYDTIQVSLGLALSLTHEVDVSETSFFTRYHFSSPIEMLDIETLTFKPLDGPLDLAVGAGAILRAPDRYSLGVLPENHMRIETNATSELDASLAAALAVVQLNGRGINTALYKESFDLLPLGTLAKMSGKAVFDIVGTTVPFNLKFYDGTPPEWSVLEPLSGYVLNTTGILPFTDSQSLADIYSGEIRRVFNFGVAGCDDVVTLRCAYDPGFAPVMVQYRISYDAFGNPLYELADDFAGIDLLLSTTPGAYGVQPGADYHRQLLQALLPDGGSWSLPPLPPGEPAITPPSVPEPATWMMLVLGFGIGGGLMRRRRAARIWRDMAIVPAQPARRALRA